ncbi:helix-turn-helix domain-containing protein [Christiangramia forsetii]|uniref:HTH_3 family transcriptional regulator protein n=2 Tax=Christiangramia forsetii TaxID=411153 RepID=A0M1G2_CHRFK|nr:helix-turn-helix transcriptional regulator [Christiangramia forsetii]GGG42582.1 transcriptional regulator [Christiangramia forsetii]CAL66457.1 HTH_3 family transcriptional regulator protein [Christiangramia forsetii KT0803]
MVNTEKFSSRLNKILEYYDISAASFADKIEVGRSSISHILSGRNKPSLDFVMKVVKNFPEVELYWLLNGKGKFPSTPESKSKTQSENREQEKTSSVPTRENQISETIKEVPTSFPPNRSGKQIQKIVIFYTDGSFEAFEN